MKEEHEQRTNNKDNAKEQKHNRNIKTPKPKINHQRKAQSITQNTTQHTMNTNNINCVL